MSDHFCSPTHCAECQDGKYVCRCLRVTEDDVICAIMAGACSVSDICVATKAGDGCTSCHRRLWGYIERYGCCQVEESRRQLVPLSTV